MQFIRLMVLMVLLAASAACAGGGPADLDAAQSEPDDAGRDTAPTRDVSDATDPVPDVEDDPCGVCCPGERTCLGETSVGVCADDGSDYTEEACGDAKICEQGSCIDEPVCTPGETTCHDGISRLVCRADGTGWRTESCGDDASCIDGECLPGAANGDPCTSDVDCAGGTCRCGSDESCSPAPSRTYCTATCTPGSCGPGEICVASDSFNDAGYDHCAPTCNQTCPLDNMTCASLPTRDSGELTFEQACYFKGITDVGEECISADKCTGGTCLQGYFDNTNLCTFECTGDCPPGTACVELQSGAFHCTPLCGDGSISGSGGCPLEGGGDRWDIQCATRNTFDGFARRVCVST